MARPNTPREMGATRTAKNSNKSSYISRTKLPTTTKPFNSPTCALSESTVIPLQMFLQMLQMFYRWGKKTVPSLNSLLCEIYGGKLFSLNLSPRICRRNESELFAAVYFTQDTERERERERERESIFKGPRHACHCQVGFGRELFRC